MGMYNKDDLVAISYQEFGNTMDKIVNQIKDYENKHGMKFNVIVPLLRSGAFCAFHIAARLEIKDIIPVYYMYKWNNDKKNRNSQAFVRYS